MPLQEQMIQLPFAGGTIEGTHAYLVEPPGLLSVVNGQFTKEGSIAKRYGYTPLGLTGRTGYDRIAARDDELVITDGDLLYTYSSTYNDFVQRDRVAQPVCTRRDIVSVSASMKAYDSTVSVGYIIDAWISASDGHVYGAVTDATTGAFVLPPTKLNTVTDTYSSVRVTVVASSAVIAYSTLPVPASIYYRTVDLNAPVSVSGQTTLISGLTAQAGGFALTSNGTNVWAVWVTSSGTIRISRYDANMSLLNAVTFTFVASLTATSTVSLAATISGTRLFIVVGTANVLTIAVDSTTLATVLGETTTLAAALGVAPRVGVVSVASGKVLVIGSYGGGSPSALMWRQVDTSGNVGSTRSHNNMALASAPFVANTRGYALALTTGVSPGTLVLLDLFIDDTSSTLIGRPVGVLAPRQATYTAGSEAAIPTVSALSSTAWTTVGALSINGRSSMTRMTFDFSGARGWLPAELARTLYLSGGVESQYDGHKLVESGFIQAPRVVSTLNAGGSIAAGTYDWRVCWEWVDALGHTHRSQPSASTRFTFGPGPGQLTLTIQSLNTTLRQETDALAGYPTPVYAVVYRTKVGPGSVFQRIPADYASATANDPLAATVTFVDNTPDASLTGVAHPFLYTDSGTYENVCPPGFTHHCEHQSRIFGIGDDELTIWFSEEFSPPDTPAFHDEFTLLLPERAIALASLEGRLIIFGETNIYIVTGDGPAPNGTGGTYSTPQRIASDVGCIEPRSVVVSPLGVLFQSPRGIMLLDRSLGVNWVGEDVQDSLARTPTITSATLVAASHQVRFTCEIIDGPLGDAFQQLVWDYQRNKWTRWTIGPNWRVSSACMWSGTYVICRPTTSDFAYREAAGTYKDNATWVTLQVETPNIHLGGFSGFQRIWRVMPLFERRANHGLIMDLAYDYGAFAGISESWTDAQLIALSPEQVRYAPARQKCQALRVRFTDTDSGSGTGEGPVFIGLLLKAGVLPGETKWIGTASKR